MDEMMIFDSKEFGSIRTMTTNDEVWFVGKDVAEALGYSKARNAIAMHVSDEDKKDALIQGTPGGAQNMTVINESGLYALIFGSKLESAKRFKHWVTSEVLPKIRKVGTYSFRPMSTEEIMRVQLSMIDKVSDRVTKIENTMNIDYGQQRVLEKEVAKTVIESLGGKGSNAYREISKKVFSECNHDVKDYFNVNSRNNIPRLKFDDAVNYIRTWTPCVNTRMLIKEYNTK